MSTQSGWRWCNKCRGLYYALTTVPLPVPVPPYYMYSPGVCPAGGGHSSDGSGEYAFDLDAAPAAPHQDHWRWCFRCQGMFFARSPHSGHCPAGGQHDSGHSGLYFALNGDGGPDAQGGWRWCKGCEGLFHAGSQPQRGRCPAGGKHDSAGSRPYAVPWDIPDSRSFHSDIRTNDSTPVGGWIDVAVNKMGHFTFSGHMHNSGFPNYQFAVTAVVMTRSGVGYGVIHNGNVEGTVEVFGRERDQDWVDTGTNSGVAENWRQVVQGGTLYWSFMAKDTITQDLQQMLNDLAKKAAQEVAETGLKALVALVV